MLQSIAGYLQSNSHEILDLFTDFFTLPFSNPDMMWMVIPMIITILVMESYFSKHKKEGVGWNTATANSLVLIFVSMDLLRYLHQTELLSFSNVGSYSFSASILALFVLLEGLFLFFMDFSKLWPKFLAFHFSSHLTVNLTAYAAIVIVYGALPFNASTLLAVIFLFSIMNIIFFLIRTLYPSKE
jgi:hypothetical protein